LVRKSNYKLRDYPAVFIIDSTRQNHLHSCLIYVEIINDRVWIQLDNTEDGIAEELIAAGIPKQDIVLGFHEPEIRPYTGFAIA
jgi:XisI protein